MSQAAPIAAPGPAVRRFQLDAVRADLAGVVEAALEPAHVWVWTSRPE